MAGMDIETDDTLTRIDYKRRVYKAMNHISRNIDRDLSLTELADIAAFSPFHFHRIFKAIVGENVAEFSRRLRMDLAVNRLLADPEKDVGSIASSCGYSSPQNFAKAFKKAYGVSPTGFRDSGVASRRGLIATGSMRAMRPIELAKAPPTSVTIRELPATMAATVRRIGMDRDSCSSAFSELLAWASDKAPIGPGKLLALYWDNPDVTPAEKCRFDCCLTVGGEATPDSRVFFQEIGGGTWAFCRFETGADRFRDSWEAAFRWLVNSGYECRPLPCLEIYHNDAAEHPQGAWIYDIAIPLRRR